MATRTKPAPSDRHDAEGSLRDHGEHEAADALPETCLYSLDRITGDRLP